MFRTFRIVTDYTVALCYAFGAAVVSIALFAVENVHPLKNR